MLKNNVRTKPLTTFSESAARVAFAAAAVFLVLFAILHIIEPEFDPSWRFISEYELGQFGWMMVIAFLSLAVSSVGLFIAIQSQIRTIGGYIGLAFLAVSTIGFLMAAIFITDPITLRQATWHGSLHSTGAALGGNIAGAALFLGWSLARNKAWISARRSLLWITALAGVGWIAAISMSAMIAQSHSEFGPGLLVGWPNRILIVAYAAWMMVLAWRVLRFPKSL